MIANSRIPLKLWLSVVVLLLVALLCVATWLELSAAQQALEKLEKQLSSAQLQSISSSEEQQRTLKFLLAVEHFPELEQVEPALWLSRLRASIATDDRESLRARVLIDKARELSRREEQRLLSVPLEFELEVADIVSAGLVIRRLGESLGSYSSVETCQLSRVRQLSVSSGFRLRCRLLKVALHMDVS